MISKSAGSAWMTGGGGPRWTTAIWIAGLAAAVLVGRPGIAGADEPSVLPIRMAYGVHTGCPVADAFLAQVLERTPLARKAGPEEAAETLVVTITRHGDDSVGKLVMVDSVGVISTRKVLASSCEEVVSALALVAALTIDPAATGMDPEQRVAAELTSGESREPERSEAPSAEPTASAPSARALPGPPEHSTDVESSEPTPVARVQPSGPSAENPTLVGAGVDLATTYDSPTLAPRVFSQLPVAREILPSAALRLSVHTARNETTSPLGSARFWWGTGRLEACPWRGKLSSSFGFRPCGSMEAGWVRSRSDYADAGGSVTRTSSTTRLWLASTALVRAEVDAMDWVRLEAESGVTVPWRRYAFSFQEDGNERTAREIPAAGGFVGVAVAAALR